MTTKYREYLTEKVNAIFKTFPDYESKKKELNRLIDKRGDKSSNLSKQEQKDYIALTNWWDEKGKD